MNTFISIAKEKSTLLIKKILLLCFLTLPAILAAQPSYSFSYLTETYTTINPAVNLLTAPKDDVFSSVAPIGFTFNYNGINYTNFKVSSNGFVNLGGNLSPGGYYENNLSTISVKPILTPFWDDLLVDDQPGTGSISYKLTGNSGSYILKIEFMGMSVVNPADAGMDINFQVWLYEGTNVIEFRYGSMGNWTGIVVSASIGINSEKNNDFLSVTPNLAPVVSFVTANNSVNLNTYLNSGLIYRFTPVPPVLWEGTTSTAWAEPTNWNTGTVPVSTNNVTIPAGKANYPVISSSGAVCQKLVIESGGELTVTSSGDLTITGNLNITGIMKVESNATTSGSLIVAGISNGNLTFQRFLTKDPYWHLIASPVVGQLISDYYTSNPVATNGGKKAITTYNEVLDDWDLYPTGDPGTTFITGNGYSTLTTANATVSFYGKLQTDNKQIPIVRSVIGWNLVGNPFLSAIAINNFLSVNSGELDPGFAAIYLWDPVLNDYITISNSTPEYIQAGQGFFVRSKTGGGSINFTKAMQTHQKTAPFKSANKPWPTIKLTALSGNNKSSTVVSFNSDMTLGLDVTYDAGMFKNNPDFSLYSRLVVDNGIDFAIQCLPEDYQNLVIPFGIDAPTGTEITFIADLLNLPDDCNPYIEDRIAGKFVPLYQKGGSYSVILNDKYKAPETFFLHTSKTFVTQSNLTELDEPFKIIANTAEGFIRIISTDSQQCIARVIDLSGRTVAIKEINIGNNNLIYINGNPGVYLINIENKNYRFNKKLFWNK